MVGGFQVVIRYKKILVLITQWHLLRLDNNNRLEEAAKKGENPKSVNLAVSTDFVVYSTKQKVQEEERKKRDLDEQEPIQHYTILDEYYKDGCVVRV